jgi:methylthioribose-1-phosphate isomerase
LLKARQRAFQSDDARIEIMTHCNAGRLATVDHGTALSPVYAAHAAGLPVHVWVSETRPRNQGLLTAWELREAGVPHTLIADNAAGLLLMQGKVDLVIVGADRIAANGDTANKVGNYLKALAAQAHGVPFYVAAPLSTIDFACPSGASIPIEERAAEELGAGDIAVANPAFDVTPAALISGIISERGVAMADQLQAWQPT